MRKILENQYYKVIFEENSINLENKNNGVVIIPVIEERKIMLLKVYRKNIKKEVLELPRGFLEEKEEVTAGALRELKEETNCECIDVENIGYIYPDSGIMNSKIGIAVANVSSPINIILEQKESILDYEILSIEEVKEKIKNNIINDGFTISAIFKYILKNSL